MVIRNNPPSALAPHHLALKVRDLDLCERFYSEVLGLAVVSRKSDDRGKPRAVWLEAAGMIVMLELTAHDRAETLKIRPGWHLMAFTIAKAQREDWKRHLAALGVAITEESPFSVYFRDPEDNLLALSHYPEPA